MADYDHELTRAEELTRADQEMRQRASAATLRDLLAAAQQIFPTSVIAELTGLSLAGSPPGETPEAQGV